MAPPNVKIKHLIRSTSGNSRFPKLDECAHFHYENVELGPIKVVLSDKPAASNKGISLASSSPNKENEVDWFYFLILVMSNDRKWVVRRSYRDFLFLDTQLHRCVYDRKYSLLIELQNVTQQDLQDDNAEQRIRGILSDYLERFSQLAGSLITCGPVLNWLELDNRGNRLIVTDEVAINTPAVAAAYVVICYTAKAADEISFDVGDMISVIDMPPSDESTWWRGKRGFEVGFFPSECVEVIGDKVPRGFKLSSSTKPVFRKHGKLIAFFRSFLLSRPSRRKLKQSGILKERVFGCDLAEHLLNTGREIPLVLKCCTEFIEEHGVVDGIYRLSGVSSNIQRLRNAFDEDCATNLGDPTIAQDIHSVASLLKMYFRELPNPLLTYQLYDKFVSAVQSNEDARLLRIRSVVQQLPPPHYRTLQYLLCHLARVAACGEETGMTPKNVAIVWAPNLLRSRDVENGGVGALHVVGVQAVLTEYLIRYYDLIFDEKMPFPSLDSEEGSAMKSRPKSLAISTPTKLLSLEEARARALSAHLPLTQQKYIDVGGGPDNLPPQYHTVIDLPPGKQSCSKLKKSPSGWKAFFSRGWQSGSTRDKNRPSFRSRKSSTTSLPHTSAQLQEKVSLSVDVQSKRKKLRTVKSAESLVPCSKDSSPVSNDAQKPMYSHPSSPEASMDSSFSFEAGSKSPSLQKHTRSSSHESYFDNSMDVVSDPPAPEEEEHSLFYYVNEEMQKMQQCSPSAWRNSYGLHLDFASENNDATKADPIKEKSPGVDSVTSEKSIRKQKLDVQDDFAQAKIQRLSWMEDKDDERNPIPPDTNNMSLIDELLKAGNSSNEREDSDVKGYIEDYSFWLPRSDQSMFCKLSGNHEEGYKLDPFSFYDCTLDKQCVMSSDTESGSRTVVERYGNAETILVEVHATQDSSSSEGEQETFKFVPHFEETDFPYLPIDDLVINTCSSLECIPPSSAGVSPGEPEADDTFTEPLSSSLIDSLPHIFQGVMGNVDHFYEDVRPYQGEAHSQQDMLLTLQDDGMLSDLAEMVEMPGDLCSADVSFAFVDSEQLTGIFNEVPSDQEMILNVSRLSQNEDMELEPFKMIPPSPVYPTQNLRTLEFQDMETKSESLPLPKKRPVFNMPSSAPIEEVRKKFEQQATSNEKPKEVCYRSTSATKDSPTRLTDKHRKLFEAQSAPISDSLGVTKRKSDGVAISKKAENIPSKRHSEPPQLGADISPVEKPKKCLVKLESLSPPSNTIEGPEIKSPKSSTPSLFTQLKIRKLQSLQKTPSPVSSKEFDPWSDPILDVQEEYHPMVSYPHLTQIEEPLVLESIAISSPAAAIEVEDLQEIDISPIKEHAPLIEDILLEEMPNEAEENSANSSAMQVAGLVDEVDSEKGSSLRAGDSSEDESIKRERINRIKEERRAQLREKLKPESFRLETEEKEKVQSKFRLRKDVCPQSTMVVVESEKKKASEIACNNESNDCIEVSKAPGHDQLDVVKCLSSRFESSDASTLQQNSKGQVTNKKEKVTLQRPASTPSAEDVCKTSDKVFSRPIVPGDIRDRVAMFERSADSAETCRLGPKGKFLPKQNTAPSLTPSYVR